MNKTLRKETRMKVYWELYRSNILKLMRWVQ